MTKAEIQTLINTKLATGSNITASEHREVETAILDFVGSFSPIKCYGKIGPVDITSGTINYTVTGNIVSATRQTAIARFNLVRVVMPSGSFSDTNYKVRIDVESGAVSGGNVNNDIRPVMFQKVDALTFDICLEENDTVSQDLYFHIEAVAI
jgi:hypothetical protein